MKILSVVPYLMGVRGSNVDHLQLLARLHQKGHDIWALATIFKSDPKHEIVDGVNIFRINPLIYINKIDYGISFPLYTIYKWIKTYKIDYVLGVMEMGTTTLSAAFISALLKKPFILIIQGSVRTIGIWWADIILKLYDLIFSRMITSLSTHIVILSSKLMDRALYIGALRDKICVIPSGIDLKDFTLEANDSIDYKEMIGFSDDVLVIGYCGRLVSLKGISFLIQALAQIKERHKVGLLLIGDGTLRHRLEEEAKSIGLRCKVTGWIERSKLPHYLAAVDVYVSPSLTEGLSISIMEAMAMQKPIVATDVGGTSDLVKDGVNGFLCPPASILPLVNAIKALTDKEKRLKMGIESRKLIERFDWGKIVNRFESLLRSDVAK